MQGGLDLFSGDFVRFLWVTDGHKTKRGGFELYKMLLFKTLFAGRKNAISSTRLDKTTGASLNKALRCLSKVIVLFMYLEGINFRENYLFLRMVIFWRYCENKFQE